MFIDDIKIGKKLISGFLIVVLIAVLISIIGFFFVTDLDDMSDELYTDRLLPVDQLGKINTALYIIRGDSYKAILLPEEKERSLTRVEDAVKEINGQIALYEKSLLLDEEKKSLDNFKVAWGTYSSELTPVIAAIQNDKKEEAISRIAAGSPLSNARTLMDTAIADLKKINLDRAAELKKSQDTDAGFAKSTMIILTILAAIIGISLGVYLTRSITLPLGQTVSMIENMNIGRLGMRLKMSRKDEVGVMAQAMDNFADSLQGVVIGKMNDIADGVKTELLPFRDDQDEIAPALNKTITALGMLQEETMKLIGAATSGNLNVRGDVQSLKGGYQEIIKGINATLDAVVIPVNESMRLADSYSKGIYTDRFNPQIQVAGDFIRFRDALNRIGIEGSSAISEVQRQVELLLSGMEETSASVEEVTASSGVLAQSSGSVSELADHSGDGVRQVLIAMDDLSATVGSVAQKAEDVSNLTIQAVDLSHHGASLAGKAEAGMQGITTSFEHMESLVDDISKQMAEIGNIVRVISDIAEQTNLLALNAAIEAARAGDAGLGFAVVADEVKSLALESQKSTENIANIIGTLQKMSKEVNEAMKSSSGEVHVGSEAVTETLKVFSDIVRSINEINRNVGEVAGATQEQAASVEEITASVGEVGKMIEQTAKEAVGSAAASEESSAALDQISRVIANSAESVNHISHEMSRFTV